MSDGDGTGFGGVVCPSFVGATNGCWPGHCACSEDAAAEEAELSMDADTPARTAGPLRGPSAHCSQLSNSDSKSVTSGAHVDHHPKSKAVRRATGASNANGRAK